MDTGRIAFDSRVHFGQPCVRGTRIPVYAVLQLVGSGQAFDAIVRDFYPELVVEDIQACVQYALDRVRSEQVFISPDAA